MEQKDRVQSIDRALLLLEIVADHDGIGLTELSKLAQLNKTTVHRLLSTLVYNGYVEQDPKTGHYGLTFKLFQLGNKKIEKMDSINIARSLISDLSNKTGETVHLVVEDNYEVVYIDKFEPNNSMSFRMHSRVGQRAPMYCTAVGKALLAHYTDEVIREVWEQSDIKPLTTKTITNYPQFMEEIAKVRSLGYAIDDEENEVGVYCISSVYYNHMREIAGAISISIPMVRIVTNTSKEYIDKVLECCEKISKLLGYH